MGRFEDCEEDESVYLALVVRYIEKKRPGRELIDTNLWVSSTSGYVVNRICSRQRRCWMMLLAGASPAVLSSHLCVAWLARK